MTVKVMKKPAFPQPQESLEKFRQRLKELGSSVNLDSFDLVICNTLLSFWGIELARLFDLPTIWHVHESMSLERCVNQFFSGASESVVKSLLKDSLANANRVVFQADASRRILHNLDTKGTFRTIPGGIDLEEIAKFKQDHTKSELRTKHGIPENHTVISVVGTTCERKGQHIFLEALYTLKDIPNLSFVLVGAREGSYLAYLRHLIKKLELKNIHIVYETKEVYDFFGLSDLFVCSSFEESFPRVILEAMAFELKIISTNVFGIPEMIRHHHEAYLVEPGNPNQLAEMIRICLAKPDFSDRLAGNAYARLCRMYDNKILLHLHTELAKGVSLS